MKKILFSPWTKRALFLACLVPLLLLVGRTVLEILADLANIGQGGWLTANPVEYIEHDTGNWALRFLLITLGVTPLRKIFEQPLLTRFRRMLGLFAFFYACVHLMMYLTFDQIFSIKGIIADVIKRPYITVGTAGFLMMLPLAITSRAAMVRRLGPKRWQRLHRLVYFATLAGVIHYYWLVKSDVSEPLMYGAILALLMLYRVRMWTQKSGKAKPERESVAV
jgi:sulfoxide reductase heme-binding subunit YedZ